MTDTKALWKGEFGDKYTHRNRGRVPANIALFGRILASTDNILSVLELGCGTGQNLEALCTLLPGLHPTGVEINHDAAKQCTVGTIHNKPIMEYEGGQFDLVFTKGLLIHVPPDDLPAIYKLMHQASRRYIMVAEYYSPTRVEVPYRGKTGALWKADYAGELLDQFSDLRLVDYGFVYRRDIFPQDDLTWMLLERVGRIC